MPLDRTSKDGENITVGEAIGLALWRYIEEDCKPALTPTQLNANMWALRMVDDGEVEYDVFHLNGVDQAVPNAAGDDGFDLDLPAQGAMEQIRHALNQPAGIHRNGVQGLPPCEG